ncbi:chemotaxis protein CheB [Actinomadura fibrosa]|uniref:protein-glutamate methylesterase n=1 Tax=Actinomadura fibrosa TaxID=111802 RepID=A0ABW2XR54_9ACTN|nr:chemotaxis protein CheB [Actinomadura fibrosa]
MVTAAGRDIVVIAASAGGIGALQGVMAELPGNLPAAVLVVLHVPPTGGRALPNILNRAGPLPAAQAADGEPVRHGRVYVAPPDHHLLLRDGAIHVSHGPKQHNHRPAADPLFESAAAEWGPRVTAVVLSGTLDDGAAGAAAVAAAGGAVAVQDPDDSTYDGMPRAALAAVPDAAVLPLKDIGSFIAEQSRTPVEIDPAAPTADNPAAPTADNPADRLEADPVAMEPPGVWSGITCPECGGPLNVMPRTRPAHYECRLGHGWSAGSLLDGQADAVERALWVAALRLEERSRLTRRMAADAEERGHTRSARLFRASSAESEEALVTIRSLIEHIATTAPDGLDGGDTGTAGAEEARENAREEAGGRGGAGGAGDGSEGEEERRGGGDAGGGSRTSGPAV